jgi:hypothetical protein
LTILISSFEQKTIFLHCNELCKSVHAFAREMELRQSKEQGVANMIEWDGNILGYAAGIGILNHAVEVKRRAEDINC